MEIHKKSYTNCANPKNYKILKHDFAIFLSFSIISDFSDLGILKIHIQKIKFDDNNDNKDYNKNHIETI